VKLTQYTYRHPTLGDRTIILTDDSREAWREANGTWTFDDEPTRIVYPIVQTEPVYRWDGLWERWEG